jgi:hypothetical protein
VKATCILSPLFGVQFLLLVYRPPDDTFIGRHYHSISAFMCNSQVCKSVIKCHNIIALPVVGDSISKLRFVSFR